MPLPSPDCCSTSYILSLCLSSWNASLFLSLYPFVLLFPLILIYFHPSFFFLFFPFLFPILSSLPLILVLLPSLPFPFRPPLFPYKSPKFLPVMTNEHTAHTHFHLIRRQTLKTDVRSYLNTLLGKRLLPSREIPKRQTFKKLIGKRRAQAKIRGNPLCSWQHQNAYWPLLSAASCRNDKIKRFRTVELSDVCSLIKASRAFNR